MFCQFRRLFANSVLVCKKRWYVFRIESVLFSKRSCCPSRLAVYSQELWFLQHDAGCCCYEIICINKPFETRANSNKWKFYHLQYNKQCRIFWKMRWNYSSDVCVHLFATVWIYLGKCKTLGSKKQIMCFYRVATKTRKCLTIVNFALFQTTVCVVVVLS